MKILSISDIITNSSSEVFVFKADKKVIDDIKEIINDICEAGRVENTLSFYENVDDPWFTNYIEDYAKDGDLIVKTHEGNTPYWLQYFLENLRWHEDFVDRMISFKQIHI